VNIEILKKKGKGNNCLINWKENENNGKIKQNSIYKSYRQINKDVLGSTLVPCKEMNE
jgi:hypothetical protein